MPDCAHGVRTEKMRTIAKKNIKLAARQMYTYQIVPAVAVLDDIMEVNRSLSQRGGRAMDALYANRRQFEAILVWAEEDGAGERAGQFAMDYV
jgi:hypothetical protein